MKLEVGMYVRTIDGIVKIEKIEDGVMWDTQGHVHFGDFIKASHNIIDLIEVGDYVNGHKIIEFQNEYTIYDDEVDDFVDKKGGYIVLGNEEGNYGIPVESIKSIVTKEQFEQMQYKVGE